MIEFEQKISNKDYFKAITIHYFGYKSTIVTPALGLLLLIAFIFKQFETVYFTIVGILWAVFLLVRPFFSIFKTYSEYKKSNPELKNEKIKFFGEDSLTIESGSKSSAIKVLELFGYREKSKFLFLYITQTDFLIIDKEQLPKGKLPQVITLLINSGINKIK